MKIFHEAPLCVFDEVQELTDGDYFLVHLFEENPEYLAKARESVSKGRYTILDNSIFELGKSFDSERFLYWVNELQPTEYIIPDVLEDSSATVERLMEWKALYEPRVKGSKSIGVVQGEDYDDVVWCYNAIKDRVDKIAFSFDYAFLCPHAEEYTLPTRHEIFMRGRQRLLKQLLEDEIIDTSKPHHALGCFLPQEFIAYREYKWLESLDTSSPVVAGINKVWYGDDGEEGLREKDTTKVIEWMDKPLTDAQRTVIRYNIREFRRMACGG